MPSDRATTSEAIATVVDTGDAARDLLVTDGPSIIARLDQIAAAYNGQAGTLMASPVQSSTRRGIRDALRGYSVMMSTALADWGKSDGVDIVAEAPTAAYFARLREWMDDQNYYVTPRGWTRGSEPTITGLATYRLLVDELGENIESGNPEVITVKVVKASGNRQSPQVSVRGEPSGVDAFELLGSGMSARPLFPIAPDAGNTGNLIANSKLTHNFAENADVTALGSWVLSATDDWLGDTTRLFRGLATSIKTTTQNAYIEQVVTANLDPTRPYLPVIAVYLDSVGSGNAVTVNWGGKSQTFSSVANDEWVLLAPDRDLDLWPRQFDDATNGGRLRVTFAGSSGTCYLGFVAWVPMTRLPTGQWMLTALQDTTPVIGASGTITDSLSAAATLNHILPVLFPDEPGAYLKSSSDSGSTKIDDLS
jgi:hypothetical protein